MNINIRFATTAPNNTTLPAHDITLRRALVQDVFKDLADKYMNGQTVRIKALTKQKQQVTMEYTCDNPVERYQIVSANEMTHLPSPLLATTIKLPSRVNKAIMLSVSLRTLLETKATLEYTAKAMRASAERDTMWNNVRRINAHIFNCVNEYNHKIITKAMHWGERNNFYSTVTEDLMRNTAIKVFSPQETDNFNIPAKLKFENSFDNNYTPLTLQQLADLHENALAYGVVDSTFSLGTYGVQIISRQTKHGFTEEIYRTMFTDDASYTPAQDTNNFGDEVITSHAIYKSASRHVEHPAIFAEQYKTLCWLRDNLGDEALMEGYHRCPICGSIYHENEGCEGHIPAIQFISADKMFYSNENFEDLAVAEELSQNNDNDPLNILIEKENAKEA